MGREVRRVPANWKHPTNKDGEYIPLLEGPYSKSLASWEEERLKWDNGLVSDWNGGWKAKPSEEECPSYEDWNGPRPEAKDYMPEWPEEEKTHLMMYETCTEGTPISPAIADKYELAHWLEDNKASAFGDSTASWESWLATIEAGWAISAVIVGGKIESGVEFNKIQQADVVVEIGDK